MAYIQSDSPFLKKKKSAARTERKEFRQERRANRKAEKGKAPSRKKSEGNYAEVKKGGGTGKDAGGGMTLDLKLAGV